MRLHLIPTHWRCLCVVLLAMSASMAVAAAGSKPDALKTRRDALEAGLVPAQAIPQSWLQDRIHAAQVVQEMEEAWVNSLRQDPPDQNQPGKKSGAARQRERNESVERRDVFLLCLDKDKKEHELYRFDGGAGKPFGYVIMKKMKAVYWLPIGVNPAK